jgi:hypothetical protein
MEVVQTREEQVQRALRQRTNLERATDCSLPVGSACRVRAE